MIKVSSNIKQNTIDVLLVTTTKVETSAIFKVFQKKSGEIKKFISNKTYYDLGIIGGAKVILIRSEIGSGGVGASTLSIQEGISALNPDSVIMAGIAFGMNPNKQRIGDILVGKQLKFYELQRIGTGKDGKSNIILQGEKPSAAPRLLDRFRDGELNFDSSTIKFGTILSGEKLIDNIDFRDQLKNLEPEAIGGEMEGAGLYSASYWNKTDWILIKAICDWADGKKTKNKQARQKKAAENAAAFVLHVLNQGGLSKLEYDVTKKNINIKNQSDVQKKILYGSDSDQLTNSQRPPSAIPEISLSKLPSTGLDLFGRENEIETLDMMWRKKNVNIFCLIAWGGVGKTTLVNNWLKKLADSNYCGAERVYAWSFYLQGSSGKRQSSADEFLSSSLRWFGDPDITQGSPWEKGVRLARLIKRNRCLLILDGLEPLQNPPGELQARKGNLKDLGLQALLRELAAYNPGLCVITSRLIVNDLVNYFENTVISHNLEYLAPKAGCDLLKKQGVKGTKSEIQKASIEFNGHALALKLLGRYLKVVHQGDIRKRDLIPKLTLEERHGGHARRVMESYENWLSGKPELTILYLMGLFDRPVEKRAIETLLAYQSLHKFTDSIINSSCGTWHFAVENLRDLQLLSSQENNIDNIIDCHPLIREHFGEKLKKTNPEVWKKAHYCLYKYYQSIPVNDRPSSLEEMEPLIMAISHGCEAKHYSSALTLYKDRISQGEKKFLRSELGAVSANLALLSSFFIERKTLKTEGLSETDRFFLLCQVGIDLRMLGRIDEAWESFIEAQEICKNFIILNGAINVHRHISQLFLTMGKIKDAIALAREAVLLSKKHKTSFYEKTSALATLGDILHHAGSLKESLKCFQEAEQIQKEGEPKYAILHKLAGYRYCDLLITLGAYEEVISRSKRKLRWKRQTNFRLGRGLALLSLGRAHALSLIENNAKNFKKPKDCIDIAIDIFRKAGYQDYLCRGLLSRIALNRHLKDFSDMDADFKELLETAERSEMKLHMTDYKLESIHVDLAKHKSENKQIDNNQATTDFNDISILIHKISYFRRLGDLKEIQLQLSD